MRIIVLHPDWWSKRELTYVERELGPIVSPNTYRVWVISRTPGGSTWWAWKRRRGKMKYLEASSLEKIVEGIQNANK